ncbi:glycerol-3-phosphate responsive antiterminator [Lactovum odontotermitis]
MQKNDIISFISRHPRIAAVNNDSDLEGIIASDNKVVYVLYGNVNTVHTIVQKLKAVHKLVFVNLDFIEGLSPKEVAVDFLMENTQADGIISSKALLIRAAVRRNVFSIHRSFMIDSKAFHHLPKQIKSSGADLADIQPGAIPKVLKWVQASISIPIIASGLVCEEEDILAALEAGAIGVSSTNHCIWIKSRHKEGKV